MFGLVAPVTTVIRNELAVLPTKFQKQLLEMQQKSNIANHLQKKK